MLSLRFVSAGKDYTTFHHTVPAPCLRRTFTLREMPVSARITVCGLGFYEAYANGEHFTKGLLAPYISSPDDILYYDEYDVTSLCRAGRNALGFMLGNGMHNCPGGDIWDFQFARWRSSPRLAVWFRAEYADGTALEFEADESFVTHPSPIYFDDLRAGEFYDARMELPGWADPDFDDSVWTPAIPAETPPRGERRLCRAEPIVTARELRPVSIRPASIGLFPHYRETLPAVKGEGVEAERKGMLYDFGENNSGNILLRVDGRPGQKLVFQFCEALDENGDLDLRPMSFLPERFNHRDIYICKGEKGETWTPSFTYHGFRYCLVMGLEPEQATDTLLTYRVMSSDLKVIGGFACSDDILNKLQQATQRSDLSNFFYFPTDCPHREKNGWTADAALSCEQVLLNLTPEESYREWLRNICKAQRDDGALPGIIPTGGWGFDWGNGPAWDCVLVYLPFFVWRYRGDIDIIRENAASVMRYLRYIMTRRDEKGLIHIGLGDWCQAMSDNAGVYDAPLEVTDTILCCDIARKSEAMFRAAGFDEEADFAKSVLSAFRTAARANLIDPDTMTVSGCCQTSQAMAIFYDIFDENEKPEALKVLLSIIEKDDRLIRTGVLGGRILFRLLSQYGYTDLAYDIVSTPRCPSYANWILRGATTLWENFFPEGAQPNSLNHHFWGDISGWMIECLGGICVNPHLTSPDEVRIAPHFASRLTHASSFTRVPSGEVKTFWERKGDTVTLTVTVPDACCGEILADAGWVFADGSGAKKLAAGEYVLRRAGK